MAGGLTNGAKRTFGFWSMVGGVMIALKLKDRLDEYNKLPTEDAQGRVALRSSIDDSETTPFRDGDLETASTLDTEIPGAKQKRKRSRECCVCCGLKCGLFWKAFGIVCLIFIAWYAVKLAMWAATPSPTGLEGMPEYSTSLGCEKGKYFFEDQQQVSYNVGINVGKADHSIDVRGGAVGTLVIAQGEAGSTNVKYEMTLRSDKQDLASKFSVTHPSMEEIEEGSSHSRLLLTTPGVIVESCMRYDIKLFVPPQLKRLHIQTHATTHIKFDDNGNIDLDRLFITMYTSNPGNLLLPNANINAKASTFELTQGWLVGQTNLLERTVVLTQRGNAVTNLHVHPVPSLEDTPAVALLETTTGAGRTDIFYENDSGSPHRPIQSTHRSSRNGDLYLTYKQAEFNGKVKLDAKSYSATGLRGGLDGRTNGTELPWVGNPDGGDSLTVSSPRGWVGLYF
ncbi:unnamed protein product [Somion occarium]|uniref:Adhesin domain-containing protein n=1 Tax=Somion occarium TaxID=3059160 RepID=A0ABP1DHR6_9APHY